jgi:succinate dehydrogenase/fumarate reductase flavoprotein subunit
MSGAFPAGPNPAGAEPATLSADVLVIGGGLAGAWAALSAAEQGAGVVLVDKGYCGTSGVTATAGVGHWWMPEPARPAEVERRTTAGGGLTDPWWMYRTMDLVWSRLPELDRWVHWPQRDGQPYRRASIRGPEYMRLMRARVRRAGVRILDHHPATQLLRQADGTVAGAAGIRLQEGGGWACAASAVILATGGTAFLSRLLGANNNTGDGHLMAAEAGAHFAGMEFSSYYTVAAAHSTMTRSIPFMYGTYRDCDGQELELAGTRAGTPVIARALARGPVTVTLDRMPRATRDRLRNVQPNFLLPLVRRGIDPFRDPFEITLRGEGTIRGTGGVEVTGTDGQTGVEGLYAAGDVASRVRIVGGASGGGSPNSAWCVASGTWTGRAAARRAAAARARGGVPAGTAQPPDLSGLVPRSAARALDVTAIRDTVRHELNDHDKNLFRTEAGLRRSLTILDGLWSGLAEHGAGGADRDGLRTREAAALVATGRWCLASALARPETRGMHRRTDAPGTDPRLAGTIFTGGLDRIWTERPGQTQQEAS